MGFKSNRDQMVASEETAQALWYVAPGRAEIRPETLVAPGAGEVRVRALHGALSRGTERLIFSGRVPAGEFERMRAPHMGGAYPFPVKYGYATVGRVELGPAELKSPRGVRAPPASKRLHAAGRSRRAGSGRRAARARRARRQHGNRPQRRVGRRPRTGRPDRGGRGRRGRGRWWRWLCGRLPGTQVTLVDIDGSRAALARTLGIGFSTPDAAPGDCDLVVHASGSAAGLATALGLAGNEATVLEMSWYGAGDVAAPLGGAFHSRRLKLVASQVGQVAASHRPRWTHRRRLAAALDLLADPRLDALLAPAVAFRDLPARLPGILAPESGVLCQLIDYPIA